MSRRAVADSTSAPVASRPALVPPEGQPCVVLGEAPARTGAPAWAPDSASGRRLATLAGLPADELRLRFGLDNLLPYADPTPEALRDAGQLYQFLPGWWYVVAGSRMVRNYLGARARPSDAAGWWDARPPMTWYVTREGATLAMLPHPSGKNRHWNDRAERAKAQEFLRAAMLPEGQNASKLWRAARARHDEERREARRARRT